MKSENDVRNLLQAELVRRCRANPAYSLRSFARSLRVDHAALSQIINGKRPVSKNMLKRLAESLNLRPQEVADLESAQRAPAKSKKYLELEADMFAVVADWYHFAILELSLVRGFRTDPNWIAQRLGVSVPEIKDAITRLQKLKFLEVTPRGWKNHVADGTQHVSNQSSSARRLLQQQILTKSLAAVNEVGAEKRSHSSMIMSIDSSKLEAAREMITRFRNEMDKFLSDGSKKDSVYALHVGLFPLEK